MTATVGDVVAALEAAYLPALAASGTPSGSSVATRRRRVSSVLFAVDPVPETVDEVIGRHQLLVSRCCCADRRRPMTVPWWGPRH